MKWKLRNLSRNSAKATLSRAGKYECKFCGQFQYVENEKIHEKACWGRCKECKWAKLECDAGRDSIKFKDCRNSVVGGKVCAKLAGRKDAARQLSVVKQR